MSRKIVGIQVHHSTRLSDAHQAVSSAYMACLSLADRVNDEKASKEATRLAARLLSLARKLAELRDEAKGRMQELWDTDPERFVRCREGFEPWPDESVEDFEPRCCCHDRCRQHFTLEGEPLDLGEVLAAEAKGWRCQCRPCPAHPEAEEA